MCCDQAAILAAVHGQDAATAPVATQSPPSAGAVAGKPEPDALHSAEAWVSLLDRQRWNDSWNEASKLFQAGVAADQRTAKVQSVRSPLDAVSTRTLRDATESSSLPGAPAGHYEIIQFQTDFAKKPAAVETVVLTEETASWKIADYFIR